MSPIYISPMCNVESDSLLCGNNKIRNSLFLSSHGIRAKRENLIFGRSCFIPISFSAAGSPSHRRSSRSRRRRCRRRLFGQLFSGRKPHSSKRTRPIYPPVATPPSTGIPRAVTRPFSGSSPSTRRRVRARVGACLLLRRRDSTHRVVRRRLGLLSLRRSNPSPPDPPFGHFCAAVTFPSSSVFNSREPGHLQSTPELSRDPDLVQPSTSATAFTFSRTITNTGPLVMYLTRPGKKLLEECSA